MYRVASLILFSLSFLVLAGQPSEDLEPPTNARYDSEHLPWQVDLMWTPPPGWEHSAVDRWYDYDRGIQLSAIGSGYIWAEAAARWDSEKLNMYDEVYLTKIKYFLTQPEVNYYLRVYQVTPLTFDTLLNMKLQLNLTYSTFDTIDIDPILLDTSKDLWIGYWVNSMAPCCPLPCGGKPAFDGYGNMFKWSLGSWTTLLEMSPEFNYNWNIGGYLETPNDTIIYPLFNVYRALDEGEFELLNEEPYLDTIFYDYVKDLSASHIYYHITCVYEDGESEPSNIVDVSFVGTKEIPKQNVMVYPNPAKDHIFIDSGNKRTKVVSIMDLQGNKVVNKYSEDWIIKIDTRRLSPSLYFVKMVTEGNVYTAKFVISR